MCMLKPKVEGLVYYGSIIMSKVNSILFDFFGESKGKGLQGMTALFISCKMENHTYLCSLLRAL